ncbi:protein N-lysine methyltransferase METTL21D-like [Lineus longissimus]|uniref:protein N-lysine methyltransferase METTL21D-like n=1 Tax=Lineus longissimus TaxID=88925 RepID=UPI002B4D862F
MAAAMENVFVRDWEKNNGEILRINQLEIGDVGCVVWDAALVLSSYIETERFLSNIGDSGFQSCKVLELGSGTGIVGLQASTLGASVTITDLEDFIPLMKMNIETNKDLVCGSVVAKTLKWGQDVTDFGTPDVLLLADCIYYGESLEPLVSTIKDLSGPETIVLCCYEERTTGNKPELEKKFFQLIREHFDVDEIPQDQQHPVYHSDDIHIMRFKKS